MPDILKIAGDHILIYEAYYKQRGSAVQYYNDRSQRPESHNQEEEIIRFIENLWLDPKESNEIGALEAAKFLKKSGLSDVVLSRIWDLSDPTGRGFLNKDGFFVALKLIGLAQDGSDINMKNIYNVLTKPPRVGDLPKVPAQVKLVPTENTDWSMRPEKRQQYEQLFESLGPSGGLLPGAKVRNTLMNSKLPVDTLGRIWDLADQDRDGSLDKHEFCVAMHLVYEALDKRAIPATLPPQLQRNAPQASNSFDAFGSGGDGGFVANFPTDIAPPPVVPPLPAVTRPAMPPAIPPVPMVPLIPAGDPNAWVVTTLERCRYEEIFNKSDTDRDGLVSGFEIKEVFLQSGVPQNLLAQIWGLCDTNQSGKLRLEEFCLAMWFVDRAKKGVPPPEVLAPNMVPPGLRKNSLIAAAETKPTYNNPELEMISKEIEELYKERRLLEQEVAQKEADVRIKRGEERSLQSEKDTLTATLKQLENQKGEAQKRLDDLKNQRIEVDAAIAAAREQVNKIRDQCQKQEDTLKEQEGELDSRRSELQKLKDEEQSLEREYNSCTKDVDRLTSQLQDTQLEISQVKAMVTQIQEYQRQMTDALAMFRSAIDTNDPSMVSDYSLKIEPEFREAKQALEEKEVENANKRDPFGDNKAASNGFGGVSDGETGFGDDFKTNGFATQFDTTNNGFQSGGGGGGFDDGFTNAFDNKPRDPFGSGAGGADPFAETRGTVAEAPKDEFGCDPFAILHAPTNASQALTPSPSRSVAPPRPESPSPALPPKKAKQPPPRPAPPRPLQGPTPTKPAPPATDAFGDSSGGGGFANFADFDNKNLKPATTITTPIIPPPSPVSALRFPPVGASPVLLGATTTTTSATVVPLAVAAPSPAPSAVSAVAAAVDFVEDPFKDYRYEDPFSIEDPFADDASGEDVGDKSDPFAANTNPLNNRAITPKDRLEDLFGDTLNNNFGALEIHADADRFTPSTSTSIKKSSATADPFDAFNDNFSKKSNTDQELLFRAFGTTAAASDSVTSAAFPETTGLKTASPFGDDDAFGKMDFSNNNNGSSRNGTADSFDFANFGAFETISSNLSKSSSSVGSLKRQGAVRGNDKKGTDPVPVKFNEDYSKDDLQFEADLQAALQRSKFDQ